MTLIEVKIRGKTPLLQHRFIGDASPIKKTGAKPTPNEEIEKALYRRRDGTIYQPGESIRRAMITVAADFRVTGKGKKTYKQGIAGGIQIDPEIPLVPQEYVIDARRVVIPATRGAQVRYRPKFEDWKLSFTVELLDEDLDLDVVKAILVAAGHKVGIGDNRLNGFGRFEVVSFEQHPESVP